MRRAISVLAAMALSGAAFGQDKFEVKVAAFVGAQHFMSQWLVKWGE